MKIATILLCGICVSALPGFAALGGNEASLASDQRALAGQMSVTAEQGYTVHAIARTDGTVVREYVSPSGAVFGISWQAPALPRLSQLLGTYFAQFQAAMQTAAAGQPAQPPTTQTTAQAAAQSKAHRSFGAQRFAAVRQDDLVVESAGKMRDFRGRAYVNSLLPSGVTAAVIQ